jgi:RimJ/RimL family protein N-acetyltransferase
MTDPQTQSTPEGTPYIPIQTKSPEQIYLTPLFRSDAQNMTNLMSTESIALELISPPWPYTLASAEWWINNSLNGKGDLPICAIRAGNPGPEGKYIGGIGVVPQDPTGFYHLPGRKPEGWEGEPGSRNVEIGYSLLPEYQGRGIMRPAVRAVVAWARRDCGARDATIVVAEGNAKSRAVVEGMGEFVPVEGSKWEVWPESKGGMRRECWSWVWKA